MFTINDPTNEIFDAQGNRGMFADGDPVYEAYLAWVAQDPENNIPAHTFNYVTTTPSVVTMRQGRLAMLQTPYAGGTLLDVIEAMLDSIPDPTTRRAARIDWEYAQEIKRDFPLVQQLTAQLGLTERQIDDLFTLAATL